jgi:hypothetical protein
MMNRRLFVIACASSIASVAIQLPYVEANPSLWVKARLVYPGTPYNMNWVCSLTYWRENVVPLIPDGYELAFLEVYESELGRSATLTPITGSPASYPEEK